MFKFIIFCAVASLCVARSLNDEQAVVTKDDAAQPKDIAIEDVVDESVQTLLANIESLDDDKAVEEGADKVKGFFARFTSTTTSTSKPFLTLSLSLNADALNNGTATVNTST